MRERCFLLIGFFRLPISLCVVLWVSATATAAIIRVGEHNLQPDMPGQEVEIFLGGGELIRGFNLRAQLGDGMGPVVEPVFNGIDFADTIWKQHTTTELGGVVAEAQQFMQASIVFDIPGEEVAGDGLLTTLTIDTTGLFEGEFALSFADTEIGENSDLILVGGQVLAPEIANGLIRIVPEPTCFYLSSCFYLGLLRFRLGHTGVSHPSRRPNVE